MKWLIYGSKGWIGRKVCRYLNINHQIIIEGTSRVDNEEAVNQEIITHKPDRILSFIGRTHGDDITTIDYLEEKGKLFENVRDNLYGPIVLANLSKIHKIHFTYLGTGCIFNYDSEHPIDSNIGYTEDSKPNFFGSSYSIVKGFTDRIMHFYSDTALNIRIRMPISSDLSPRNFITKILKYDKICSIPNSMTVLDELIPIMLDMAYQKKVGTINLTNPGAITHNQILQKYKEIVDNSFTWKNFTLEEQSQVLRSERSNNLLDTSKLESLYKGVSNIHDAVESTLYKMKYYF